MILGWQSLWAGAADIGAPQWPNRARRSVCLHCITRLFCVLCPGLRCCGTHFFGVLCAARVDEDSLILMGLGGRSTMDDEARRQCSGRELLDSWLTACVRRRKKTRWGTWKSRLRSPILHCSGGDCRCKVNSHKQVLPTSFTNRGKVLSHAVACAREIGSRQATLPGGD